MGDRRGVGAEQERGDGGCRGGEDRADEEGGVVAAVQVGDRGRAARCGARREAREHGQAERAAHHERGVDDAGGEPGLLGRDVAHRGEQHRVHRHPDADAEHEHRGQHVGDEAAVDRRAGEQHEAERDEAHADRQRQRGSRSACTSRAERPSENAPMIRFAGRNARPTSSGS